MITTISMRIDTPRRPRAIPTRRSPLHSPRAVALLIVSAFGAAIVCALLLSHGLARAATPVATPLPAIAAKALPAGDAAALRAAVRELPAFPDPYPAAAAVAP